MWPSFRLLPESVVALTQVIVFGTILIYLISREGKSKATWMLVVMFLGMTIASVVQDGVIDALQSPLHPVIYWLDSYAGMLVFFGLVNFAHAFQGQPFQRAAKWTIWISSCWIVLVYVGVGVLLQVRGGLSSSFEMVFEIPNLIMALGAVAIFLKKKTLKEEKSRTRSRTLGGLVKRYGAAEGKEERALRAFAIFALALSMVISLGIWRILGSPPKELLFLYSVSYLPLILTLVILYVNSAAEPSTFQVKLVALSLYSVLALLAVSTMVLFPVDRLRQQSRASLPKIESQRLVRGATGGYQPEPASMRFDAELGDRLDLGTDQDSARTLGFAFPFFDQEWNDIYVYNSGIVTYGSPYEGQSLADFYSEPQPKLAAFHAAMGPSSSERSGVYFKTGPDTATITWNKLREFYDADSLNQNTIQLRLHADGVIEIVCERVDVFPIVGLRGLHPGSAPGSTLPDRLDRGLGVQGENEALVLEDFGSVSEQHFRAYTHDAMVPIVFIVLGSTVFIVLIFPLFFRVSLIAPLKALLAGVQHVEEGNLQIGVPVRTLDEIGILTRSFNRMTASLSSANETLKANADDLERLKNRLYAENVYLQDEIRLDHNFQNIISRSEALKKVLRQLEQVAETEATILILGETGTGKELIARAAHNLSHRSSRPMVKVNCAALPADLIESELFGHEKGAFTGAIAKKIGRFELADKSTIFLDEIGELPLDLQVKLLRVLQEGEFERLGSSETICVDVRIIAATNRDLDKEKDSGRFREDLFYRLNVFPIHCPPLRDRKEDIPLLISHFVYKYGKKIGKTIAAIPQSVVDQLVQYDWPGNIRELENVIERAVITSPQSRLVLCDWEDVRTSSASGDSVAVSLEEVEKHHIIRVLESTNWRVSGDKGAARILDINPKTLQSRMAKLGIERPGTKR